MSADPVMLETRWIRPVEGVMASMLQYVEANLLTGEHLLGDGSFFQPKSIQELTQDQGVEPVKDISVFAGGIPEDEDVDEMLAEIYRSREP